MWNVLKSLMPTFEKKFKFIKKENKSELFEFINRSQIEKKFGGTAENIEIGNFFPPNMPSSNYQLEDDNDGNSKNFVSEEKYVELVKNDLVTTISPYIRDYCQNIDRYFMYTANDTIENKSDFTKIQEGMLFFSLFRINLRASELNIGY